MALIRSHFPTLICQGCRKSILKSFMISLGIDRPVLGLRRSPVSRRALSHSTVRIREPTNERNTQLGVERLSSKAADSAATANEHVPSPGDEMPKTEYIPWYLQPQVQPASERSSTTTLQQKLPKLPSHSPPLLQPVLQHVSIELGIDDLALLDLRTLEPPPALGTNLLMIIGTARSEKHLHVSADKLCRWLRSEHALSPYADGLLGRNELKLKLRRRAKRSRLLSAAGVQSISSIEDDDGLRTGWVCVNLGQIEGGELPDAPWTSDRPNAIIGFGTRARGCSVVVQMMTEEKRAELDLEKLWNGILRRNQEDQARAQSEDVNAKDTSDNSDSIQSSAPAYSHDLYLAEQQSAIHSEPQ